MVEKLSNKENKSTIYALSSGSGKAGVAVFRISGPDAFKILPELTQKQEEFSKSPKLRWIYNPETGEKIDQGLVLMFKGPASFTGEDVVELHVHGGVAVKSLLTQALSFFKKLKYADAGEFTKRAYANKKISLVDVEALGQVLDANTTSQLRFSQKLIDGALEKKVKDWENIYLKLISLIEATIDFSDEGDVSKSVESDVQKLISKLITEFQTELERSKTFERIQNGVTISLIGAPNVGKSSLLNALLHDERCIVSDTPGTTRDVVEVHAEWGGNLVIFQDTAGIRLTEDKVEKIGIQKTFQSLQTADICLFLYTHDIPSPDTKGLQGVGKVLHVMTKADQHPHLASHGYSVSIYDKKSLDAFRIILKSEVNNMCDIGDHVIGYTRHKQNIVESLACLEHLFSESDWKILLYTHPEVFVETLKESLMHMLSILSLPKTEDILGHIFSSFCIGK